MLSYTVEGKRRWFIRGDGVPPTLWPHEEPGVSTYAVDLAKGLVDTFAGGVVQADGWINHPRSRWYEVFEQSLKVTRTGILTLLWWKNEQQLLDLAREED